MDEKVYFENSDGIRVTSARFIVPNQTFAMSGVTSVKRALESASLIRSILSMFLIIMGLLALIGSFIGEDNDINGIPAGLLGAILFLVVGIYLWVNNKNKYFVVLNTSSGESKALETDDGDLVDKVVDALNESIIARG